MQGKTQTSACSPLTSQDAPSPCTAKLFQAEPPVCLTDHCLRGQNPPTHIHTGGTSPNLQVDLLKCLPNQSACLAAHSPALGKATPLLPWRTGTFSLVLPCPSLLPQSLPKHLQDLITLLLSVCSAAQLCPTLGDPSHSVMSDSL